MRFRPLTPAMALALRLLSPCGALAQTDITPTAPPGALLSGRSAVAAGLVLVATLIGDQGLRGELQEYRGRTSNTFAEIGTAFGEPRFVLPVLGAGVLAGRLSGHAGVTRTALHAVGAVALAGGVTTALKYAVGRTRPQGDGDADEFRPFSGRNSFPSGHTAVAFALATAVARESASPAVDAALYGVATLTAFARLNDDRHWTSDVLAGALVGHLSARWLARRQGGLNFGPTGVTLSLGF